MFSRPPLSLKVNPIFNPSRCHVEKEREESLFKITHSRCFKFRVSNVLLEQPEKHSM